VTTLDPAGQQHGLTLSIPALDEQPNPSWALALSFKQSPSLPIGLPAAALFWQRPANLRT